MRFYLPNGLLKRADADLADLTDSQRVGDFYWDPDEPDWLVCPMDTEPTKAQKTAIRRRLVTENAADERRLDDLRAARAEATTTFERLWLDAELARYGETG